MLTFERLLLSSEATYDLTASFAESWLKTCDLLDRPTFYRWLDTVEIYRTQYGLIVVSDYIREVRATIHPLFWDKSAVNAPQTLVELRATIQRKLNVPRLEVKVLSTAGHTIRRLLRSLGFSLEGTLRCFDIDHRQPSKPLISTEVWSIIDQRILEELYGKHHLQ